jgi:hypothetical protein
VSSREALNRYFDFTSLFVVMIIKYKLRILILHLYSSSLLSTTSYATGLVWLTVIFFSDLLLLYFSLSVSIHRRCSCHLFFYFWILSSIL